MSGFLLLRSWRYSLVLPNEPIMSLTAVVKCLLRERRSFEVSVTVWRTLGSFIKLVYCWACSKHIKPMNSFLWTACIVVSMWPALHTFGTKLILEKVLVSHLSKWGSSSHLPITELENFHTLTRWNVSFTIFFIYKFIYLQISLRFKK